MGQNRKVYSHDSNHEISCISVGNSDLPELKSLMAKLKSITKTIEECSIIQSLHSLHSKPKGRKQLFHGDFVNDSISHLKKGKKCCSCAFSFYSETNVLRQQCKVFHSKEASSYFLSQCSSHRQILQKMQLPLAFQASL